MIRLEKSEALQRKIRQDDLAELGIPTWALLHQAIQAGRKDAALDFLEYGLAETQEMSYQMCSFVDDTLTYLSSLGEEEEVEKALRYRYEPRVRDWLSQAPTLTEAIYLFAETVRGHFGNQTIVEEADRYVLTYDPCGTGGALWRTKNVGMTKKAYPWSWGKSGIPYYCAHCCVHEIIATEVRGYPMYVNLPPEKPEDTCVALYYKKPELIPEEYFTRLGMTKTIK